ncbi:helix-turn-helix domain-containing protein [Parvibaculaceae bacterium PLY_AMNH_Bact1]|nr:helix-turn-helix domain-containing protein [Parvibaculaceae bacterium PLY_AMNH_Bact1]
MPQKTPNPVDIHVGSRVRMRRMLVGMSQEALGEQLGLTFQQVQKYEKGSNRIGASRLYHIAQTLNVPVDYFYEGLAQNGERSASGFSDAPAADFNLDFLSTAEGVALVAAFSSIEDADVRKRVLELVKVLAQNPSGQH